MIKFEDCSWTIGGPGVDSENKDNNENIDNCPYFAGGTKYFWYFRIVTTQKIAFRSREKHQIIIILVLTVNFVNQLMSFVLKIVMELQH